MKPDEILPPTVMTEEEIANFRNSPKQLICVQLLQHGDHSAFSELFGLLCADRQRRAAAETGSLLSRQTPLEEQPEKMEVMKLHLSQAERAQRTGGWSEACEQRLILGRYFSAPEDVWLSLHFYRSCADSGRVGRAATEARARLSELYLHAENLQAAQQQVALCVLQEKGSGWLDSDGRPLQLFAARALWRTYRRLAASLVDDGDHEAALKLLYEGQLTAAEAGDKKIEVEAMFQLGVTYQRAGDHRTAKQFFHKCMQIRSTLEDYAGLVEAYRAMARSLHSEGKIEETIKCLEKVADISRANNLQQKMSDGCLHLGYIYFIKAQYQTACEYFMQAYSIACSVADVPLQDKAQVFLASARAQLLMGKYSADVASASVPSASPPAMSRLLSWKENRGGQDLRIDAADTAHTAAIWY